MITITNKLAVPLSFTQFRVQGDKAVFIGPTHTDSKTETLTIQAIAPKRGNGQLGNRRGDLILVTGTSVLDVEGQTVVRNRKLAVSGSIPVGTTLQEVLDDAYTLSELLRNEDFVKSVMVSGIIEH